MTTDERLARIDDKLDTLATTLTRSCVQHEACLQRQMEHHKTLFGKDGLKTRVESLEQSRWLARIGLTALWGVILAGAGAFFKWFSRAF